MSSFKMVYHTLTVRLQSWIWRKCFALGVKGLRHAVQSLLSTDMYNYLHYLVRRCRNRSTVVMYFLKPIMIIQGVSSKDIFVRGNLVKGYIQQLILLTTATCSMYATYICFRSWSKRSELRKESEEDKVKLLDMCSASEANKELIHHKVRVSDKQTYVGDFQFLPQRRLTNFAFCIGRQATSTQRSFCFSYLQSMQSFY